MEASMIQRNRGFGRTVTALVLQSVLLGACTLGRSAPAGRACTLIGCGAWFEVALVGDHVPTDFSLSLDSPEGNLVNVHCTEGTAEFEPPEASQWSPTCPPGAVAFMDFTPAQVTVTVEWAEGRVTQEFRPQYADSWPNGPQCEPACRSARVEVIIPKYPLYGDSATWELYADEDMGFRIRYPAELGLQPGEAAGGYGATYIGDKIRIQTSEDDPLVCQGECPMIESTEALRIAGRRAVLAQGYLGSIGGNVPQYFMAYVFPLGTGFASFSLYAESRYAEVKDPSVITPLRQDDIEVFERMMETLEFTT